MIKNSILLFFSIIFLIFGSGMLYTAYFQDHPFVFLALFFSSSLIVLLSLTCIVGVIWRIRRPMEEIHAESLEGAEDC